MTDKAMTAVKRAQEHLAKAGQFDESTFDNGVNEFTYGDLRTLLALSRQSVGVEDVAIFERVTRLAHTLASDVPITADARKHIDRSYELLSRLTGEHPLENKS